VPGKLAAAVEAFAADGPTKLEGVLVLGDTIDGADTEVGNYTYNR
jgi:hypothetical protein